MGHAIVARIAASELAPATRHKVEILLGGPAAERMADVSSWADWQGRARPETKPWHYVDIEIAGSDANTLARASRAGYDAARDCPAGDCIVAAIGRQEAVFRAPAALIDERREALVWLIHLVGDLHQPLHCADNHDRGGNAVPIEGAGNLHRLWDMAPNRIFADTAAGAAARLDRAITARERAAWQRGDAGAWATESFHIARDRIYPAPDAPPGKAIVERQLERAGARLAWLLDRDLQ